LIVCEFRGFVYYPIAKCGSRTVRRFLSEYFPPYDVEEFPSLRRQKIPERYSHLRVLVVVRNPVDRLMSMWAHHCSRRLTRGRPELDLAELIRFVGVTASQGWFLDRSGREPDYVVHLENLAEELSALPYFNGSVAHILRSKRKERSKLPDASQLRRPAVAKAALAAFGDDPERFGYDNDPKILALRSCSGLKAGL